MSSPSLPRPWAVHVELVEGCNRLCSFCGLSSMRSRPMEDLKFMEPLLGEQLASQLAILAPTARYEFAMHGEPTLHPDYLGMLRIFRRHLPKAQIQLTTNGRVWMRDLEGEARRTLRIVDFIALDTYLPERDQLRELAAKLPKSIAVSDFYETHLSPYHNYHGKLRNTIILLDDLSLRSGEHSTRVMTNQAGSNPSRPIPPSPLAKTCTRPFREMAVCHDGAVTICCNDYLRGLVLGYAPESTLSDLWLGPKMEAARAFLGQRCRDFLPCSRCDGGSGMRVGLLPKYPPPTKEQIALLKPEN